MSMNLILPPQTVHKSLKAPLGHKEKMDGPVGPTLPAMIDCVLPLPTIDQIPSAHALIQALVVAGIDTFFGIPGGAVSPVFDAVLQTPGARLVESRHESSAAFAAASYHRVTGRVPVVIVTAGPGATNVVTGVASAYTERVPMLIICGDVAWATNGGRLLQDSGPEGIDIEQMLAGVTRATVRVAQAQSLMAQATAALMAATDPNRPGPALLVLPIQHGAVPIHPMPVQYEPIFRELAPRRGAARRACEMLTTASHPLLVIGTGCRAVASRIRRLVDVLDVPFVTTPQAKGLISELHPRSLRSGGLAASMWARRYTERGVDAALVLGTDLDDCSVGPTPYVAPGGKLMHVDLDPAVFNRNLPTTEAVVAHVGPFVDEMVELVASEGLRSGRCTATLREIRAESPFDQPDFAMDSSPKITPPRALSDLQRAAGRDAIFVSDIGEHMLFALHYLTAVDEHAFHIHLGLGSMGSGITGAVGVALGCPGRRVVCICGDGGMQMAGMEALVAVRERLPVVFAVFNDARYNMVYHGYKSVFGREAPWESPRIDFESWARSMGMRGATIRSPGEVSSELLDELLGSGGPVVLDIRIDRDVRLRGGGRNEALQHMSMSATPPVRSSVKELS